MKFSVSTYSYSKMLGSGKNLFDVLELAKKQGFDGLDFIDLPTDNLEDESQMARKLNEKCRELGIEPVTYTVSADFLKGSGGDFDKEVERLKRKVDVAHELGCTKFRHDTTTGFGSDAPRYMGFDDCLPRLIEGCRAVTEYAKTLGIVTMTENHGTFAQDSARVEKIVNGVADENFGMLVDIGNFLCADEDPVTAVGRVARYAKHVHVKDFYIRNGNTPFVPDGFFETRGGNLLCGSIIGHGDVPVFQCLKTLVRSGYDDYFTVEFEGLEDSETGTEYGLKMLKRYENALKNS